MLSPKQNEYIRNANRRWNIKSGAVRSGKSYVDIDYTIPMRIRERRGKDGLNVILGVSRETIERNILRPMREKYTDRLVSTINSRNIAHICGEEVYCLGAEKISQVAKIQGSSIKYAYGDEVAKWNQEVFTMLQTRLDKPYSCFDGAFNPEYPGHWLKQFMDRTDIDSYVQQYTIFDNPFLPPEFVENLCKEYEGTVYYQRYILGEWALAEGLIYPMYEEAITDSVPAWEEDERRVYCLSLDYGTMNAFAALLWEYHGGVWYAARGYYYSGRETGLQKTDEEYAQALDTLLTDVHEYYQKSAGLYGQQKLETIIDPSAASFIALLNRRGKYKVRKADNDVLDGIRETATAMRAGSIKVSDKIREWKDEVGGYVWDDSGDVEHPVKVNDHYMDATRYFVKTKRIATPRKTYDSVFL